MMKQFKHNSVKIFILKLSAFFAVVILLDVVIGNLLKRFYLNQRSGYDFSTAYAIKKTKADMVIFGSSRAVNLFNPKIFEKETKMTCYNAGRIGEPIFYHYAVLKSILKRYKPKIILLSFDAGNFSIKQDAYDKLAVLLPYYHNHPEIRPVVNLKGPHEKVKLFSNIYPYNSLLLSMITGNSAYGKRKYNDSSGFFPIKKIFSGPVPVVDYTNEKLLDSTKIDAYRSFILECIHSNVKLFVVCPPYMINSVGIDLSILEGKRLAREYNINFLDFSRDTFFTNKIELFADYRHLNETGVNFFSNKVVDSIKVINSIN